MEQIRPVEIDPNGRFKYVLIRLLDRASKQEKLLVRGSLSAPYHADLVDAFEEKLRKLKNPQLECRCIGGGRIYINPDEKVCNVYGYSQGYGRADHELTCEILRPFYSDYTINWSNEGY